MVSKGISGFAWGYLWSRYRNLWINVLLHTFVDSLPLVLLVAGAALKLCLAQTGGSSTTNSLPKNLDNRALAMLYSRVLALDGFEC
jgi:membrane protease YdiL (CAAX protease family)